MTRPGDAATGLAAQKESPDTKTLEKFHRYASVTRRDDYHHRLGNGDSDGAPGSHTHRDGNGQPLLSDVVFTLSRSLNTAAVLKQVIDALVLLGATDSTTP